MCIHFPDTSPATARPIRRLSYPSGRTAGSPECLISTALFTPGLMKSIRKDWNPSSVSLKARAGSLYKNGRIPVGSLVFVLQSIYREAHLPDRLEDVDADAVESGAGFLGMRTPASGKPGALRA